MEIGKITVSEERTIDTADYEKIKLYECLSLPVMKFRKNEDGEIVMTSFDFEGVFTEKELSRAISNTRMYCVEKITNTLDEKEHSIRQWASQFQEIELIKKSPLLTPRE